MSRHRLASTFCLLLLMTAFAFKASAQDTSSKLSGLFERVADLSQLETDRYYLIGSWAKYAGSPTFHLATGEYSPSKVKKKKLKTILWENGAEERISCSDELAVWQLVKQTDGNYVLQCAATRQVLSRVDNESLGLVLGEEEGKGLSEWTITEENGMFTITSSETSGRRLSCAYANDSAVVFDNYTLNNAEPVYLYRSISSKEAEVEVLADGASYVLVAGAQAYSTGAETAASTDGYRLLDALYTLDGTYANLVCQLSSTDAKAFSLKDVASGNYLSHNMTLSAEPSLWQLRSGKLCAGVSGEEERNVCYVPASASWRLLTESEASASQAVIATLGNFAAKPQQILTEEGALQLTGGWSKQKLSQIEFTGASSLDLTAISLPCIVSDFVNVAPTKNFPIFVASDAASLVPESWHFVVLADGNNYSLKNDTELADGEAFASPYDIALSEGQLVYSRKPLQGTSMQTLCLPFAVSTLPDNTKFYSVDEQTESTLTLKETSKIESGKPYLFCSAEESGFAEGEQLVFSSDTGTLSASTSKSNGMQGTFSPLVVKSGEDDVLMLHAPSSSFRRAAAGSGLKPFRALLRASGSNQVRIKRN